jgi:hypothetical protein
MTYAEWISSLRDIANTDDQVFAMLDNLLSEDRVDLTAFRSHAAHLYTTRVLAGEAAPEAAKAVLETLQSELADPGAAGLGQLVGGATPEGASLVTHTSASDHKYRTPESPRPGASVVEFAAGKARPPADIQCRFIWVTFPDRSGNEVRADDPAVVVQELGLAHMSGDKEIYRFPLPPPPSGRFWIPSALDAGLYEAWMRPALDHVEPWGITRDLTTGERRWPELLVETSEYLYDVAGTLVRRPDGTATVGPIGTDFRRGRSLPP